MFPHQYGSIRNDEESGEAPSRTSMCADDRRFGAQSSQGFELHNVVETALARALVLAAEACRWESVAQIAGELQRRGTAVDGGGVRAEELRLLVSGRRS